MKAERAAMELEKRRQSAREHQKMNSALGALAKKLL